MNKIKIVLASLFVALGFYAHAQTGRTIQGMLRDTESRPISGAKVELIAGTDSISTSSTVAGIYTFSNVRHNRFTIKVSSMGFETHEQQVDFPAGDDKLFIPSFVLAVDANLIEEVVIEGVVTVQVKGDTIDYLTKDLKLREGALAEDALKRLDGVEVDKDGNVTAQGESVTRVRINGRDFFGGDVKTATQNLPADIIERMQVIDDYGDVANLTGNRSGDSEKVLNIQIDPKYNKGWMTTLRAGGGTEDRYQATGMWMGMSGNSQISVLGNMNNMNAQLFDFQTMGGGARGRRGGGGRPGGGMFGGGQDGITETGSIGVNMRHDFSEQLKMYGSYSFGHNDNNTLTDAFTSYIGQNITEDAHQDNNNIRANHRFEANVEWNITDKDYIKITPQFGFNRNDANNFSRSIFERGDILDNTQDQTSITDMSAPRYNISGLYNRRMNDRGRNLFINFNYDNSATINDYNQILERLVYDPVNVGAPINEIYERTVREAENKSWNAGASVSYTEPLSENGKLELTYDFNTNDYDNKDYQDAFDENGNPLSSTSRLNYSYDYDYAFTTHRAGANYRYEGEKINYSIGAAVQPSLLRGNAFSTTESAIIDRRNFNFIPIARFEYRFSRQSNLTVNYSGRANEPSVTQILPFEVSTNRTLTTIGNPELDPEFSHQVRMRLRAGDFQQGKTFFAMLSGDLTNNKIVSMNKRYNVEGDGLYQEIGYQNVSEPVYNIRSFYHYGRSFKDRTYNIMYGGGVTYNRNISYLATEEDTPLELYEKNLTNNVIFNQMLFFRYTPSEELEINPGVRYTYNMTNSSLPQFEAPDVRSIAPTLVGSVNLAKNTVFGVDLSKSFNRGYANNANPFIINTYIEQRLLRGQRGTIRLQGFDLLNEQVNIGRTVGDILTDSQSNRLARYFMLTFTFRLQKFALGAPEQGSGFPRGMGRPRM